MTHLKKRTLAFLMLVFTLGAIGLLFAQTLFNPFGSTCPPLVETALNELDQCGRIGINTTCYGYNRVEAEFNQPVAFDYFTQQGDIAQVNEINTLRTAPYDQLKNEWGVALMRVQANIPNTLPGQGVVFVLMGDTTVENAVEGSNIFQPSSVLSGITAIQVELRSGAGLSHNVIYVIPANSTLSLDAINPTGDWVRAIYQDVTSTDPKLVDGQFGWIPVSALNAPLAPNSLSVLQDTPHTPMQAFYFETGIGNAACKEAPNTLVVQGPENLTVDLNVNGMNVSLSSMLALQAPVNGETRFICVVGPCTLQLENEPEQILETFEQVFCPHQSNVEVGMDEGIGNNVVESCNPKEPIDPQDVIELIVLDEIYANIPDLLNYDPEVVKNTAIELNLDAEGLLNLIEIIREQTPPPPPLTTFIGGGFILPTLAVTSTPLTLTPDITLTPITPIFPTPQPTVVIVSSPEASPTPDTVAPVANDDSGNLQIGTISSNNILSNDTGNPAPVVISFGGSAPSNVSDHLANGIDVYSYGGVDVTISSNGLVNVDATYATGEGTITLYYRIQNSVGTDDGQITLNYGTMPSAVADTYSTRDTNALSVARHSFVPAQTVVESPSRLLFRPFPSMRFGGPMNLLFNDTLGSPVASLYSFGGLDLGGTEASHASGSNVPFTLAGASAMLHANSDGSFALTNPPFNTGTWQFKYKLKNTLNSSVGTVTIHIYRAVDAVDDGNGTTGFYVVPIGETISSVGNILANDTMGIPEGSLDNYGSSSVSPDTDYTFAAGAGMLTVNLAANGDLASLAADDMATPGVYPFPYHIANSYGGDTADVYVSVIEEIHPTVANITPSNGETLVAASTNINIVFSEAVNLSDFTLECNTVIFDTSNTTVTGNGTTSIVIDPTGTLPYGQTCNLTIETNEVTDVDTFDPPDGLASRYVSSFTTRAQPIVTAVNPANNSNISTTDTITVTFDQTVTFDPSVVTVVCDSIAQTFTPNTTQTGVNSITFTPSPTWSVGVCTFTIPANAFVAPSAGAGNPIYTFNAS